MNVIITGASRGIGLELTTQAIEKGYRVLAVARNPGNSIELQTFFENKSIEIATIDVTTKNAGDQILNTIQHWSSVDILINNAGVYLDDNTIEDFLLSFQINSIAPLFITRTLFPLLQKSTKPKVIQITSLMGSISDNESGGSYSYRASKAALNMLNKTLAQDEKWLTSVVIHPGWVKTEMGGPQAPTEIKESASGIWQVIEKITAKDSGSFFDFEGDRLPW